MGRVNIKRRWKKVKNHGIVHRVMHNFYMKINPRQKSGDAVACASVAPVRLHRLIHHKGMNTWRIIAVQGRNGGGTSYYIIGIWAQLCDVFRFGDYFWKRGKTSQKIIFDGDSKTTNPVVAKSYEKPKITSSWFYQCHPYY